MPDYQKYVKNIGLEEWLRDIEHKIPTFKPYAWYNKDGNQIEAYWNNEISYSENIQVDNTNIMAINIGMETGKIVGMTIYSVKELMGGDSKQLEYYI